MNVGEFNARVEGFIQIADPEDLTDTLKLLEKWNFYIHDSGKTAGPESGETCNWAVAGLPEGWSKQSALRDGRSTQIWDHNGNLRIGLLHDMGGSLPERFGLSFYPRFALRPDATPDGREISVEHSLLIDMKTGQHFEIRPPVHPDDEAEIMAFAVWHKTLAETFGLAPGKADVAALWDRDDITLSDDDAQQLATRALANLDEHRAEVDRRFQELADLLTDLKSALQQRLHNGPG